MKYIGFAFVLAGVFLFSHDRVRTLYKRLYECRGFLSFLSHIRRQMGCSLSSPREFADSFEDGGELSDSGFISRLAESGDIYQSFLLSEKNLHLEAEEREILLRVFKDFGGGYLDDAVKQLDFGESELSSLLSKLENEIPKRAKLISLLCATGAVGFIILLL